MTFTEKWAAVTLLNAESRDAEICIYNVQSGFPGAEAHSCHGEYYHLLLCIPVRYGSMIHRPHLMQLASIRPPPCAHRECYMRTTVTLPTAEAHIAFQSQDEIHMMIEFSRYYPSQFR